MRWLRGESPDSSFERLRGAVQTSSLKTRLMLGLIPPVVLIMVITGYITYLISKQSISNAIERASRLQAVAVRNEIESYLEHCRQDICHLAQEAITPDALRRFLARPQVSGGVEYLEVAFISQKSADHLFYVAKDGKIVQILTEMAAAIKPSPLAYYEQLKNLAPLQTWVSPVIEMEYPFPEPDNPNQKLVRKVIQMATPCCGEASVAGYLLVSIDVRNLRNILSLHNSPIWAYQRTAEERYIYLFDADGWILFQSDAVDNPQADLSTHLARAGYTGTLGRQGLELAFRPDSTFDTYWKMVDDVRGGRQDVVSLTAHQPNAYGRSYYLAYAPVRFKTALNTAPQVVAGVAYLDISRLTLVAGYKHVDTMFYITLATALVVGALIFILGRILTRPILKLAETVNELPQHPDLAPVELPYYGREITALQRAINSLITTLKRQMEEIRQKDRTIRSASLKEQAHLGWVTVDAAAATSDPVPSIIGYGLRVEKLKSEILKAAQVGVDVLIIGETGTGKQLAAEGIHRLSGRSAEPFISINCGALDENLLLDTLFGHVKGAFTEAKADRKGAFLEANRGTLFLDEIQVASARVQQALLRAIAMRKIKPLGSDRETDVDVRLIVATNVDLKELIQHGGFREDLYFRLKVITIHTVPLREQKENIAVLARHFLTLQERLAGRAGMGLSKGALSKLMRYDWPGNVRELQNCITRAVVMAERQVIQAEDIPLDVTDWDADHVSSISSEILNPAETDEPAVALNHRQRKAWALIQARGRITRSQYQDVIGGNLPTRTAIYDLQDLVSKGVLKKAGSGPTTHYVIAEGSDLTRK